VSWDVSKTDTMVATKAWTAPAMVLGRGEGVVRMDPPLMVAPMAGVTNAPFRKMCVKRGAGGAVTEMVSAHTLLERTPRAMKIVSFDPIEKVRSVQLYGTKKGTLKDAAKMLVEEVGATHIDLNFGCPVRKVTRKGGGAAIALKPKLLHSLVRSAVEGASEVPVTVKLRMGLSMERLTHVSAGKAAEDGGALGVVLHARTVDQLYSSPVHWEAIAEMVDALAIPVVGNGDVREPMDATKMMRETGASAIMVGRACLGRPWLIQQIADQLVGKEPQESPNLKGATEAALEHFQGLVHYHGQELTAALEMRKFVPLYFLGFQSARVLAQRLMTARTAHEWFAALDDPSVDWKEAYPPSALRLARMKGEGRQRVSLPDGYLDSLDDAIAPEDHDACEG